MDSRGFESITTALRDYAVDAAVEPKPSQGIHYEHVTVTTEASMPPAIVLNALGRAGLLQTDGISEGIKHGPQLEPVFGGPGSITFKDRNNRH